MLESLATNEFEYKRLTPEEQAARGILGRLVGPIADFKNPTRNGRHYSEELWEKVFNDDIMKEKIAAKVVLGELGHPESRIETDIEKAAICLAEVPKKSPDGKLMGVFDILSTPNGKILKALCDYGCKIGISSRGEGDIIESWAGENEVDPETFQCECWDAVLLPGVKDARLTLVKESLDTKKTLRQTLTESLESATPDDRRIMEETLNNLDLGIKEDKNIAAEDTGAIVIKDLQESLKEKQALELQVAELQEKLSVCYTREAKLEESIDKYKHTIRNLSERASNAKKVGDEVQTLNEALATSANTLEKEKSRAAKAVQESAAVKREYAKLNETLGKREEELTNATQRVKQLTESVVALKKEQEILKEKLNETIENSTKDLKLKESNYVNKLAKNNKLVEKYRDIAKRSVDKYIELQATNLGVSKDEVKNKLGENYSFADIDKVCEDLSQFSLTVNNLPFKLEKSSKVTIKESKDSIENKVVSQDDCDEISGWMMNLID